jgi:hypothetical protein
MCWRLSGGLRFKRDFLATHVFVGVCWSPSLKLGTINSHVGVVSSGSLMSVSGSKFGGAEDIPVDGEDTHHHHCLSDEQGYEGYKSSSETASGFFSHASTFASRY